MMLQQALADQAGHCAALGSPFMARLLPVIGRAWPHGSALDAALSRFDGDIGPKGHSLPLRIASALHALVLTGTDTALVHAYPPNMVSEAMLEDAVRQSLVAHEGFIRDWIASAPQTNEVRRSAVLIAGAHTLVARTGVTRLHLSELGASAGLNLMFDRYALVADQAHLGPDTPALTLSPDWVGPAPEKAPFEVIERRGVDLNPLEARNPGHALRLRAYLWPDQAHRLALTNAAIAVNDATIDRGDAIDWLEARLAHPLQDAMHLVFHTVAWQYFSPASQATGTALIEAAGARATAAAPLAWLRMEADSDTRGAGISARLWPGDHHIPLGRADFHGRWVDWAPGTP